MFVDVQITIHSDLHAADDVVIVVDVDIVIKDIVHDKLVVVALVNGVVVLIELRVVRIIRVGARR